MLIGYLRRRAADNDALAAQRKALADAGCKQIVEDVSSKRGGEQAELRRLLNNLQVGDVVVVPELGSLGRSLPKVARRVEEIATASASLRSLKEGIDTATPEGRSALGVIGSLIGLAQDPMRGRGRSRPAVQRTSGRKAGRRPKLSEQQQALIVQEVLSGRETGATMARRYKVSEATVSRVVAAHRALGDVAAGSGAVREATSQGERIAGVLPLSALDERLAIVGTSGSGKTYAAKGLVERLICQGARVCVIDPLGVWWGLRVGADGGASPLPCPVVVFGGLHADVALDAGMGAALGQLIGTHQIACVVDVSDLGSAAVRRGFITAFTEALFAANTEPLHLVLDEADLWAPQRAQPDGYDLLQRVEEIVRRGRIRGFVPWLITQRPAVLHKDVLSQADVLLSMKLTSSQDREAIGRWIEGQADRAEGRRILAALPQLAQGEGYVWAPSNGVLARVAFPRIRSFDSSRTPQRDKGVATPRPLPTVDLSVIGATLGKVERCTNDGGGDFAGVGRSHSRQFERRLRQQDRELAAARARVAELEAAAVQARLDQVDTR